MAIVVGRDVFVTSYAESKLVRMNWPSCTHVLQSAHVFRPRGIVYHKGKLFVACYGNPVGRIVCLDPSTLNVLHSFKTFRPRGIDAWNDLLVITQVNRGHLLIVDEHGIVQKRLVGFKEPRDVCVHGDVAYVANSGSDSVVGVNLVDNTRFTVNEYSRPNGVATNGKTTITSLWNTGEIILQCNNRNYTKVHGANTPCMASFGNNMYIVCDAEAGCLYVFDA